MLLSLSRQKLPISVFSFRGATIYHSNNPKAHSIHSSSLSLLSTFGATFQMHSTRVQLMTWKKFPLHLLPSQVNTNNAKVHFPPFNVNILPLNMTCLLHYASSKPSASLLPLQTLKPSLLILFSSTHATHGLMIICMTLW